MNDLFLFLLLVSFVGLIVGLIKPSLFSQFLKEKATRKNSTIIFLSATLVFFVLFGVTSESAPETEKAVEKVQETPAIEPIQESATPPMDTREEFLKESRDRFDEIASSFGSELDNIECYNEKCDSVIYFNFNEIPEDLEIVIRGNTATFSQFKMDKLGVSNVSIFATYNNKTIFQCDGAKGAVKDCK
ncbi:MAG TPA: hypothetical protein ENN28_03405 [Candidatus Uhrbacteria bacterium]|nr:hypothetical protein [Candidatus Uhrbacteria bacterium]